LPVDTQAASIWGNLSGENKKGGIVIPIIDGLLAATALVHNLTLVTENISDFTATGVRLFNLKTAVEDGKLT
jgi:toxin FitB